MKKHHYAFLGLLFALGATISLGISIYGFVGWFGLGFAIEPKTWISRPGTSAFLVFCFGLVSFGYCANKAGIMFHHSKDKITKQIDNEDDAA